MGMNFKCRCMKHFNQRMGSASFMSGTWKVHKSIIHSCYPVGLHRVYYGLKDNNIDCMFSTDGWVEIKYRNSERIPRLYDKELYSVEF